MIEEFRKESFKIIAREVSEKDNDRVGIGTYREKTVHRVLKYFFDSDESHHEIPCGKYVADIKNGNEIIEIQSSGLYAIRGRLEFFLSENKVTLIYPIMAKKKICWIDPTDGSVSSPKLSPKKGSVTEILPELFHYGDILINPYFSVKCILLDVTEYRIKDGWGNDGKRGCHRYDRIPNEIIDIIEIEGMSDIRKLIPFNEGEQFTSKDFAKRCGFSLKSTRDVGASLKFLKSNEIIEVSGKAGNSFIYKLK